jgi:hypothetical protein
MLSKKFLAGTGLLLLLSFNLEVASKEREVASKEAKGALFRYKNEQGTLVTSHILPPEMAYRGYQIVTVGGDILQTVAPAPTEAEKDKILQAIEQEKYDKSLLLRYGSLAELLRAQKRKMEEMEAKRSVLLSNQSNLKAQIEAEQAKAANFERQGRPVPDLILTAMESQWGNLERTEDQIRIIHQGIENEKARYHTEINRYKQLKGLKD